MAVTVEFQDNSARVKLERRIWERVYGGGRRVFEGINRYIGPICQICV